MNNINNIKKIRTLAIIVCNRGIFFCLLSNLRIGGQNNKANNNNKMPKIIQSQTNNSIKIKKIADTIRWLM